MTRLVHASALLSVACGSPATTPEHDATDGELEAMETTDSRTFGLSTEEPPGTATLEGHVVDAAGEPLAGATVTL